jgi:hypothetical protein
VTSSRKLTSTGSPYTWHISRRTCAGIQTHPSHGAVPEIMGPFQTQCVVGKLTQQGTRHHIMPNSKSDSMSKSRTFADAEKICLLMHIDNIRCRYNEVISFLALISSDVDVFYEL